MKAKRLLALVLALAMVMGTMFVPAFAESTTNRTITMTPSKDVVRTGETFTVTVSVAHDSEELKFAAWDLTYTEEYFTYVSAELAAPYTEASVLWMNRNNNPLTPDLYATTNQVLTGDIMVYTFVAKKTAVTDEPFNFDSHDVRTGNDGWTGDDVTGETEVIETEVTIEERQFAVTQLYDNAPVTVDSIPDTFDNQEHTFQVTADLEANDPDTTPATITYTMDGTELGSTAPTFTDAGIYTVTYTIEKEGYTKVDETITVVMETAAFENVAIGFTNEEGIAEDITSEIADGEYEFAYDGHAHQLVVTSAETIDGSDVTITYSLNNGGDTSVSPEITAAGPYTITYTITAPNHTTIKETIAVTITEPKKVVEVLLGEENDYTSGDKMVLVYTDAENVSFTYGGAQMYDVTGGGYVYGDGTTPYEHVFALVVDSTGIETIQSYEDNVGVAYGAIDEAYVIDYTNRYDVNYEVDPHNVVDSNDIISAYSVLERQPYAPMTGRIKLDNNFSKTARTDDITPIIGAVY